MEEECFLSEGWGQLSIARASGRDKDGGARKTETEMLDPVKKETCNPSMVQFPKVDSGICFPK
jgi:hypothetical protein